MNSRIYKYDNVKAFLILMVVIGHMTTDYVSDSYLVRWITLWIYTFHMPAFVFVSGLVHKRYIDDERAASGMRGETALRWGKVWGFLLCGWGLKLFLQITRTLMGQHPLWHWLEEPGIPWYLFVMAEYELLFYVMRRIDGKVRPAVIIAGAFALSAAIGYFPVIDDTFCLSRMINFLPIYAAGYYLDMRRFLELIEGRVASALKADHMGNDAHPVSILIKLCSWLVIAASVWICANGGWKLYRWRKWFTGRRSYEFLSDYFTDAVRDGWWTRLAVWGIALIMTLAIIAVIPDRDLGPVTTAGSRTLNVYFWHRPVCYLFRTLKVLPRLVILFGGTYDIAVAGQIPGLAFGGGLAAMIPALIVYIMIGIGMTALFSLRIFEHPASDLMKLGKRAAQSINPRS